MAKETICSLDMKKNNNNSISAGILSFIVI